MPRNNGEAYRIINFFDWTGGIQDRRKNPLAFPHNALLSGENVELADCGLKTRGGISITSAGSLPAGEVMAMRQVRFPTNETSYLVVQCRDAPISGPVLVPSGQADPKPGGRVFHATGYDPINGYIWIYGGVADTDGVTRYHDLWFYDVVADTFTEVTDAVDQPTHSVFAHEMVWDSAGSRFIIWGGYCGDGTPVAGAGLSWVWRTYTPSTNAFAELTLDEASDFVLGGWRRFHHMFYRPTDNCVYLMGGWNDESPYPLTQIYRLNLTTLVGTSITATGPDELTARDWGNDAWTLWSGVYNADDDVFVVVDEINGYMFQLNLSTWTWTALPQLVVTEGQLINAQGLAYCSGRYYQLGSDSIAFENDTFMCWMLEAEGSAWQEGEITENPLTRTYQRTHVVGTDLFLVYGQVAAVESPPVPVEGIEELTNLCLYVPAEAGEGATENPNSALYASPTPLPTTEGVFELIYDLGANAGVCSFAVLNDRLVVTEGVTNPPLVTGLSLSDDASDWLVPKAVLVQQAGDTGTGTAGDYYDVSPQVCDKDPDTVANIGNIRSSGALYICCDMPQVEAFHFEMETVNTLSAGEGPTTITDIIAFTANTDITRKDLKAAITHWHQDAAATGHFEDAAHTPITLGNGNAAPEVIEGVIVSFADADVYIKTITDDGEGAGEVELTAAHANADVAGIYGISVIDDAVTVKGTSTGNGTTWSAGIAFSGQHAEMTQYAIRMLVSGADISLSGDSCKFTFTGPLSNTTGFTFTDTKPVLVIARASIVEQDSGCNGTTTPTPITFNGGQLGGSLADWGQTLESDVISYAIDETKNYLVTLDVAENTRLGYRTYDTGARFQQNCNLLPYVDAAATAWLLVNMQYNNGTYWAEQQTISAVYLVHSNMHLLGLTDITVYSYNPQPQNTYVAHTTDASQCPIVLAEDFTGVTVEQSQPGDSILWHFVSKDRRATFQVFKNDAWRICVQQDGVWQYLDGADAWQNATEDTLLSALEDAAAITENQMSTAELEAVTSAQWKGTDGIELHLTPAIDFAVAMKADQNNAPELTDYTIAMSDYGTTHVYGWQSGSWEAGDGWTDNTVVSDIPWAQSGTVEYLGTDPFEADYSVLNEVPGFWFKFVPSGTSADCAITRILYKAPCQPLSNIGDGQPDIPMGFVYVDASDNATRDYTVEVSDNALTEVSKADVPMAPDDYLYVGFYWPFNEIEVTPYAGNNANPAVLSAAYWNGEAWTPLPVTDGTKGSQGKTLSGKGKISWTVPADWRAHIPFDSFFSRGYWIRLSVSATLSSDAAISEVRIYSIPPRLHKYKFAAAVKDRIALLSRPDAWDQADLSRTLEEYGFSGQDSASYRIGGMDQIQCAIAAWNGLLVGKTETWHQLLGGDPSSFAFEGVEAARHIPVNSRVMVKAPMTGLDSGTRSGLFFLNRFGAFVSTGLHTDSEWNTGRGIVLSDSVNWWDGAAIPRLDLDALHRACGEYWPVKNWIVWAVPMITEPDQSVQATNNRLIIYDLSLRTWLPPFTISLASFAVAHHHNETAPGKLGEIGLYGGDYQGRIVRLFGPADTTDLGVAIPGWVETGWLHFGSPEWLKLVRRLRLFGRTAAGKTIAVKIWVDGNTDASRPESALLLSDLDTAGGRFFALEEESLNLQGRFFKFRIEFQDITHIYGLQIGVSLIREWGAA